MSQITNMSETGEFTNSRNVLNNYYGHKKKDYSHKIPNTGVSNRRKFFFHLNPTLSII